LLENITRKKLDYCDLKPLEDTLKVLASSDEIKYYYEKTEHAIKSFQRQLENFDCEARKHSEIIVRYDEVISDKASKHVLN
jgi:hypothetical protein